MITPEHIQQYYQLKQRLKSAQQPPNPAPARGQAVEPGLVAAQQRMNAYTKQFLEDSARRRAWMHSREGQQSIQRAAQEALGNDPLRAKINWMLLSGDRLGAMRLLQANLPNRPDLAYTIDFNRPQDLSNWWQSQPPQPSRPAQQPRPPQPVPQAQPVNPPPVRPPVAAQVPGPLK